MTAPCPFRTPLRDDLVRCEWLSTRLGSGVATTWPVCEHCQRVGPPADGHADLEERLNEALAGRIIVWRADNDRAFNGLTAREAARRLKQRGVRQARLRHVILRAVAEHGMPPARALEMAEELGL